MIRLDRIKISIPRRSVIYINDDAFIKHETKKDLVSTKKMLLDQIVFGVKRINIAESDACFDVSSKILRSRYYEMICMDTLPELFDRINKSGVITVDPDIAANAALLYSCDITQNIRVAEPVGDYIKALSLCKMNHKYRVDTYGRKESVVFSRGKKMQTRMIVYNKYAEVIKDKALMNEIGNGWPAFIEQFNPVVRVEQNLRSFEALRKATGTKTDGPVKLLDFLNSDSKLLSTTFADITSGIEVPRIVEVALGRPTFASLVKYAGYMSIMEWFKMDMNKIRKFIKENSRNKSVTVPQAQYLKGLVELQTASESRALMLIDQLKANLTAG